MRTSIVALALLLAAPAAHAREPALQAALDRCDAESRRQDDPAALTTACQAALQLARRAGDREVEGMALNGLAQAQYWMGHQDRALALFDQALAIDRELGNRQDEASVLANVGSLLHDRSRYREALDRYREALEILRALHDDAAIAIVLSNMGLTAEELARLADAQQYYQEALAIARACKDRLMEATALANLSTVSRKLARYGEARAHLVEASAIFGELGDRRSLGQVTENLARIDLREGQPAQALERADRAHALLHESGYRARELSSLTTIGAALDALGRPAEALDRFHEAIAGLRQLADVFYEGRALLALGTALVHLGRDAEALDAYQQALLAVRRTKGADAESEVLGQLMRTWRRLGEPGLAIFHGKQAVNAAQRVRSHLPGEDREAQRDYLTSVEAVYRELADLLLEQGRLPEAQQVLALLKDEEFGALLGASAQPSARAALTPLEAAQAQAYDRVTADLATPARQEAFRSYLADLRDVFAAAPPQGTIDPPELAALAARLRRAGSGTVAVYTLLAGERCRLLVVTPSGRVTREVRVDRAALAADVLAFRDALQRPSSDARPLARRLHAVLLAPIEAELARARAATVLWSLDGVLRYVPVAALHDGRRYLVERYRTALLGPGAPAPGAAARPWRAWAFGTARATAGFPALPEVERELAEIFRPAGGGRPLVPGDTLLDGAFTREALLGALEHAPRPVVHLASHFQFEPGQPASSFLLLGDGTRLTLADLAARPRLLEGVDLLALSGCDTAIASGDRRGEEIEGFAGLAQRLGARSVLASLWPVADEGARRLMAEFYRRHQARPGVAKAEALRGAQLAFLDAKRASAASGARRSARPVAADGGTDRPARLAHPYYWAPFVLIGAWD